MLILQIDPVDGCQSYLLKGLSIMKSFLKAFSGRTRSQSPPAPMGPRTVSFSVEGADNDPAAIEVTVIQEGDSGIDQRVRLPSNATMQVSTTLNNTKT